MSDIVWVAVEVYGLIVQGAHIFTEEGAAEEWFKSYTGFDYGKLYDEHGQCQDDDYDQTTIFVVRREPRFELDIMKLEVNICSICTKVNAEGTCGADGCEEFQRFCYRDM